MNIDRGVEGRENPDEAHLELRLVGDIAGSFYVPRYQRGYRWARDDVRRLLDDIWSNGDRDYCLQPVVVKRRAAGVDEWELVDGQQRLTTLHLIFGYMRRAKLQNIGQPYTLEYETRESSKGYLEELDEERSKTNIDFFHLYAASEVIREWFEAAGPMKRQNVANKFYGYLIERVRVIWYEAPAEVSSTTLFTRLNVGRIPLTDAELVKALLLTASRKAQAVGGRQVNRSEEIAQQWDTIERELSDAEVWAFVSELGVDECPTRITLLLDTIAAGPRQKRPRFYTFETLRERIEKDPLAFWNDVMDLHALIRGWFEDRALFHKVGYLVSSGSAFADLVRLAGGKKKSQFEAALNEQIRTSLALNASDVRGLTYENHYDKCHRLLRLMNIETVLRMRHSSERYSFHSAREQHWSLEHIHAQHTEGLAKAEQWRSWVDQHRKALLELPIADHANVQALVVRIDALPSPIPRQEFHELAREVTAVFSAEDATSASSVHSTHSISNLALLSSDDNAQLNNAVFEVKRQRILAIDRAGGFIPVCTRHVFLKYFTGADAQQVHFWSLQDRESYLDAMIGTKGLVTPYLKSDEEIPQ